MTQSQILTDQHLDDVLAALGDEQPFSRAELAAARDRVLAASDRLVSPDGAGSDDVVTVLPSAHPRRRRLVTGLVIAATVALVATLVVTLVRAAGPDRSAPAGTGASASVTCLVDPDAPTGAATSEAGTLLSMRLSALAAAEPSVTWTGTGVTDAGAGRLVLTADGVSDDRLAELCTSPLPALRPVAAQAREGNGATTTTRCGDEVAPSAPDGVVLCDDATTPGLTYVLGPALVSPDEIAVATALAPTGAGSGWSVNIELRPAASQRVAAYTTAHNTGGVAAKVATADCSPTTTPCATFLAVVIDGQVAMAPGIQSVITGSVQVSGNLGEAQARLLAAELGAGDLTMVAG